MNDFANFNREKSYFRPYDTHLDVYVSMSEMSGLSKGTGNWSYKLKIFCGIPVILFQCESKGCNILIHLNYPLLHKLSATSWLGQQQLTFMLLLSDSSQSDHVVCAKTLKLNKADSTKIRMACVKQYGLSYSSVENIVDVIYQQNIKNIWP